MGVYKKGSGRGLGVFVFVLVQALALSVYAEAKVEFVRTPNGGVQPQVAMDGDGNLHMIYIKGSERADIFYVRQDAGREEFSKPIQVNSVPQDASPGTVRGPRLAVGKGNRVHVVWFGVLKTREEARVPENRNRLFYARLNDEGTAFEEQKNVMQYTFDLDGGGTVAADKKGNVYVSWAGLAPKGGTGETKRAIYVTVSKDGGKTFSKEKAAAKTKTGACACCNLRSMTDSDGKLYIVYRAAMGFTNRDSYLLSSTNKGKSFKLTLIDKWKLNQCPGSRYDLAEGRDKMLVAWETENQVFFAWTGKKKVKAIAAPFNTKNRQGPVVAQNKNGDVLLVWMEGNGRKATSLVWQIYDSKGKVTEEMGNIENGVPARSVASVVVRPDGTFVVVH